MITKKRLQELINEGATIWVRNDYQTYEINTSYFVNIDIIDNVLCCGAEMVSLDYLYETKEQAEWHLKYHATRTEELNLPTWKEVKDKGFDYIFFVKNGDTDLEYYFLVGEQDKSIQIMFRGIEHIMLNYGYDVIFNELLTEENYIKACDLCLKLFKGETE